MKCVVGMILLDLHNYYYVDEKMPCGLEPVISHAKEKTKSSETVQEKAGPSNDKISQGLIKHHEALGNVKWH